MASEHAGFRLSPQQRRIWNSNQEANAAHAQCVVSVQADLHLTALREALDGVIARHEILRTTFVRQAGSKIPLQVVHDRLEPLWRDEDLRAMPPESRAGRLQSVIEDERRPFDLAQGPTVRACLLTEGALRYVLVLTLPAPCADSLTLVNLIRDLQCSQGVQALESAEDPLQYADYAEWQNELRDAEDTDGAQGRAFWSQDSSPLVLALPLERRPDDAAADLQRLEIEIAPETSGHIETLARQNNTSASAVLLACWQALLFRLSRQDTFLVGYAQAGRNYPELAGAYGLFARTLPMPCRLSPDLSFARLVAQVADEQAQSERWQDYVPEPRGDNPPDLGIAFEWEPPDLRLDTNAGGFAEIQTHASAEPYRLKLACSQRNSELRLTLSYDTRRFDSANAQRLADHLKTLIESAAADPNAPLDSLNLVPEAMRRQLLEIGNATQAAYPRDLCFQALFERQAAHTPHAPALVCGDSRYTYAELNAAANRLAHLLRKSGVERQTRVGLLMQRSAEMIVALLGILKAGGAYVPLAPDSPKSRLAHLLKETAAPVVVSQDLLSGILDGYGGQVIRIDSGESLAGQPDKNPESVNSPDDLAYVIYTSGSTGQPKGVENTHRGLVNYASFIRGLVASIDPSTGLQYASVSPLSADLGNTCIFPCLIGGGTLHVLPYETGMDAARFTAYAARHGLDVLKITPSHLNALLASPGGAGVLPRRCLFLGGEASSWELVARVRRAGSCTVINHYGPTETTIGSLAYRVPAEGPATGTVPIGRPIANTQIYILDSRLRAVPIGVPGELYIGGDGVARGYIGQPDLTDSRFIANPFAPDGSKLYRTGDMVRYLPDASVEFLGRFDDQVKIRGFRVEPGEIEAALRAHPGVRQTVVVAREDSSGEKRLVGYYVGGASDTPEGEDLKSYLQDILPDYMIPWPLVRLASLPLGPNGKVDRAALPAPETVGASAVRERLLPRTTAEEQVASIWEDVLGRGEISVDDDFFELGGHSLLAIQVMSRVRETFQVEISLNALFESPTISALAQIVVAEQDLSATPDNLDELIDLLDGLTDEEAEALLSQEGRLDDGSSS